MSNTNAVWMPKNLPQDEQMLLALQTTPTQTMDPTLLEIGLANKLAQMASRDGLTDRQVQEILETDPELRAALGPNDQTRPMIEACLMANPVSDLMYRADLTSKPVINRDLLASLKDQTLADWVSLLIRVQS